MSNISSGHREQIKNMVKENKTMDEILIFFKTTYQIDVPKHIVYAARHDLKKSVSPAAAVNKIKKTRAPQSEPSAELGGGIDECVSDIIKMLQQIHGGYSQIFKFLRGELVKSRAQVYGMMRGAGIKIDDEKDNEED